MYNFQILILNFLKQIFAIFFLLLCKIYPTLFAINSFISTITSVETRTINIMTLFVVKTVTTRIVTIQSICTSVAVCKNM